MEVSSDVHNPHADLSELNVLHHVMIDETSHGDSLSSERYSFRVMNISIRSFGSAQGCIS